MAVEEKRRTTNRKTYEGPVKILCSIFSVLSSYVFKLYLDTTLQYWKLCHNNLLKMTGSLQILINADG